MKSLRILSNLLFRNLAKPLNVNCNLCRTSQNFNLAATDSQDKNEFSDKSDKTINCTLIPGDGVGPELVASVKEVFSALGVPIRFEELFLRFPL
ncbi:isocitrate dehydrogenase (NAD+)-like protein [Sarcoptes scabiei]|uniref:Isocitrate dehydrogenase (NAD+)-like protein n=1 Tax=Sarcoptes scabiei TaxID=52283 RepID=A0A131ZWL1_SARSC|nr:isocitrate dehydrogenase (NAD+)-like protein [Sarcoptes scabiei]